MTSSRLTPIVRIAGLILALGLLAGCAAAPTPTPEPTPTPTPPPLHLTVLHTNDTKGQTDPCG